ncbi:helix-turn-helix domain-containing protein [Enterovibrio norvegicus]|nr:helix-turn-helix domain-containing protein [Enterovibrio norvegicus]
MKSFREKGLSLREIAEAIGYSRSQVGRILPS